MTVQGKMLEAPEPRGWQHVVRGLVIFASMTLSAPLWERWGGWGVALAGVLSSLLSEAVVAILTRRRA